MRSGHAHLAWLGCLLALLSMVTAARAQELDGSAIMAQVRARHELYPYVFERQSLVMTDRGGERSVRQARQYWRVDEGGRFSYLLVFDQPPEIRGVALLVRRGDTGEVTAGVYLPAFGAVLKRPGDDHEQASVLGTDFNFADLVPEDLDGFRYERQPDTQFSDLPYYVVDAWPLAAPPASRRHRRHYIRQDIGFIERSDYFDTYGRLVRRRTQHDLRRVQGDAWRPGMTLMQNLRDQHNSLLKIQDRIYSADYVPLRLFQLETLFSGRHLEAPELWAVYGDGEQAK